MDVAAQWHRFDLVWYGLQGFTWLEEKWHVDLSGQSAEAVSTDGWSYAVDFPWLKMPPIPGSGRMCALSHTSKDAHDTDMHEKI